MSIADWIGVYGALVGTAALLWEIYRSWTDCSHLRVECQLGSVHELGKSAATKETPNVLLLKVTNVGRQSAIVDSICFGLKGTRKWIVLHPPKQPLPRTLERGEYFTETTNQVAGFLEGARFLEVGESTGRKYRLPRRKFKTLMKDYARMRQPGANKPQQPS